MPCKVRTTPNGYLAYRIRWRQLPGGESQESTGIPGDREHRAERHKMVAKAKIMSLEMKAGTFNYLSWFPDGAKREFFRTHTETANVSGYIRTWLLRKQPPLVRLSTSKTYEKHVRCHIAPQFRETRFLEITAVALEEFRTMLIAPSGKGLALKTARDIIDGTFRALYRDARRAGLATGDPFALLDWPDKVLPEVDPFDEKERMALCEYFYAKDRFWYPFVYWQFWVGTRPSEAIGLRRGRLDLQHGKVSIVISRTLGEDNPPKTKASRRTITLLPVVVHALRAMPRPVAPTPDDFVFITPEGHAVDHDRFVEQHWHRALSATGVRPRKFYATRHTFISAALAKGAKVKWIAGYTGTSMEMIEKHYSKWMGGDDTELAKLDDGRSPVPARNRDDVPVWGGEMGKIGIIRDERPARKPASNRRNS